MSDPILDVDLLAFEQGDDRARKATVDGVMASLATGFVYCDTDLSETMLDEAYGMLETFFSLESDRKERWTVPGSHGQTGYTGPAVETAATSDVPDWKEMLNWGPTVPAGHPMRRKYPHRFHDPALPEDDVPGITAVLTEFHDRVFELQRRFLRIVAVGLGAHESYFDPSLTDGPTLNRAIRYPPMSAAPDQPHTWAGAHTDINLTTVLPRATTRGLQIETGGAEETTWVDAAPPEGHVIVNTGIMLEHVSNGVIPAGWHRVVADPELDVERYSVVQFCHPTPWTILAPLPSCVTAEHPARFAGIEAADLLDQVLYDINLVEGARRVR
ncbi:MAG: 2-oxoglutarate and iron-dependent oxygenase domain-containing protein [Acidimicrobiales bacterium]|nr:2-oxoglutarate and iron-dependent oxygenase domain-containing protein [Acidimicrobiales bacterium]